MNKLEVKDKLKDNKVPEGWIKVKLGELCKVIPGQAPLSKFYNKEGKGYPFIKVNNFTNKYPIIDTWTTFSLKESKDTDILLSVAGSVGFVNYGINASITRSVFAIRPNQKSVQIFLFYLLKKYSNYFENLGSGSAQKIITIKSVEELKILFPSSLPEQHKIVEILETVDATIEKTDAIIKKYKRIKQGLMQDLLTRGIAAFEFEKDKLIHAVKKAFENGDHRFGREENLVNHLSRHLEDFFPEWDVDNEVEKNNKRQRPDIIIHKRGTDKNLFAIEVKKNDNLNAIKQDIKKLEDVMLGDYHYEDTVFIGFDIDNFEDVFKLSEKVNFILVSKNGKIKVKSLVRRFKDSPLGKIPEEWEAHQIADIANVTKLAGFEFTNYFRYRDDGEIIALRALNIKNRKLNLTDIQRIKKKVSEQLPRSQVNAGDILITYIGAYIGDTLIIKESNKYHLAPNVAKITTKSIILPEFLEIFLSSYIGKRQYKQFS